MFAMDDCALVTGGAGFIGSHLTDRLVDEGMEVHVLDNLITGTKENVPMEATLHTLDLRDDQVDKLITDIDPTVVFHLAAHHYIPFCNANPEETMEVNVMGTRAVCQAVRDSNRLDRLVYASTAAVYPPGDDAHSESDPTGPMDVYGRTKLIGEDTVNLLARETEVSVASARLFNVFGPNETNPHLIPDILEQLKAGKRSIELGNLAPARDFIFTEDVAAALKVLGTADIPDYNVYNVGTGQERTVREVVECIEDVLNEEIEITQAMDRIRESDRPHLRADTTRIETETDWRAETAFVDGLRMLLESEGLLE